VVKIARANRRALFFEFIRYTLIKLIPGLGNLVFVFYLTVHLADQYADYALLFYLGLTVSAYSSMWLKQGVLRYGFVQDERAYQELLFWGFLIFVCASLFCAGVVHFVLGVDVGGVVSCGFIAFAFCVQNSVYSIWQSQFRSGLILAGEVVRVFMLLSGCVALNALSLLSVESVSALFFLTMLLPIAKEFFCGLSVGAVGGRGEALLRGYVTFGAPLSVLVGLQTSVWFFDKYLVRAFFGDSVLSYYAPISDMSVKTFSVLLVPLVMQTQPHLVKVFNEQGFVDAFQLLRKLVLVQIASLAVVFVGVFFLSEYLVTWMWGEDYLPYANILVLSVVSGGVWQLSMMLNKALELLEETRLLLVFMFSAFFAFFIVVLCLKDSFGVFSVAWAVVVSATIYSGLVYARSAYRYNLVVSGRC